MRATADVYQVWVCDGDAPWVPETWRCIHEVHVAAWGVAFNVAADGSVVNIVHRVDAGVRYGVAADVAHIAPPEPASKLAGVDLSDEQVAALQATVVAAGTVHELVALAQLQVMSLCWGMCWGM